MCAVIPLQFLIGFYVSTAFARWWQQMLFVGFPDRFLINVAAHLQAVFPSLPPSPRLRLAVCRARTSGRWPYGKRWLDTPTSSMSW